MVTAKGKGPLSTFWLDINSSLDLKLPMPHLQDKQTEQGIGRLSSVNDVLGDTAIEAEKTENDDNVRRQWLID
jgi:hypothetical protein